MAVREKTVRSGGNDKIRRLRDLQEAGQLDQAEAGYRDWLATHSDDATVWQLYGVVAFQRGQLQRAVERLSRALQIRPDFPQALSNLGSVMLGMGRVEQAEKLFRMALKYDPDYPEAVANLGALLNTREQFEDALPVLERAVALRPGHAMSHNNLGNALEELDRNDQALAAYEQARRLAPGNPVFLGNLGKVHQRLGRHAEAVDCFAEALERDPHCVIALCGMTGARRIKSDDPEVAWFREAFAGLDALTHREKVDFLFAWGKLNDDIGEYDQAFACFSKANEFRRRTRPYSREGEERLLDKIRQVFSSERLGQCSDSGCDSRVPVFVLGMPRSGTTLTEQIIASHPAVHGAGELKALEQSLKANLTSQGDNGVELDPARITPDNLARGAEDYLAALPCQWAHGEHVTDKMPANFRHIGAIAQMFPRAAIVHVRRHPVDNLLSCFQQNFAQGQAFSNDLKNAAHYYHVYRRFMTHWHEVLGDRILDVDYEALVAEPDAQSRRLAEFIGLDWDEAMLAPHKTRRSIRTASQWQVRQPIHRRSVERWRRYEKQLQPLVEALRGYGIDV
jgi:tetratricopeptide (TPR) repeat protein